MKRLSLAAVVGALLAFAGTARANQVMHQNVNGIYVNLGSFDGTTTTNVSLFRNVANGPDSPQYALIYSIMTCDNGYPILTCDGLQGLGLLPGGSVQANSQTAHARVDTSTVAGFISAQIHEVVDSTQGFPSVTTTSTPVPGLTLDLTWRATNQFQISSAGSSKQTSFGTTTTIGGNQSVTSAAVAGSLGSLSFNNASGYIGSTHNAMLTIDKN